MSRMRGADAILRSLEAEGVDVMFGIPGGAIMPTYDAMARGSGVRHVLARHEQGAGHMAEGYARASGRVGVAIATSGPGATNLVTPIADAWMDSTPLVCITGQVRTPLIGTDAFQECDITGVTMPIVKHSWLVQEAKDVPRVLKEAFHVATTGRYGPVLVDVPRDVQEAELDFYYPDHVDLPGWRPPAKVHPLQIREAARVLAQAEKPVLYVGGGALNGDACSELLEIDAAEISKLRQADVPVVGPLKQALGELTREVAKHRHDGAPAPDPWLRRIAEWREEFPLRYGARRDFMKPQWVIQQVQALTAGDDVVVTTGVGQHQMWAMQYVVSERPRSFITSGGLGTMGYGIPAAIGAKAARPEATVVCVDGDGCFQMTAQELVTAVLEDLPIVVVLINNGYLGMVQQWQDMFFDGRRSHVHLTHQVPDYARLAEAYGAVGITVDSEDELGPALEEAIASGRTAVVDCRVDQSEQCFPMIPTGAAALEMVEYSEPEDQEART